MRRTRLIFLLLAACTASAELAVLLLWDCPEGCMDYGTSFNVYARSSATDTWHILTNVCWTPSLTQTCRLAVLPGQMRWFTVTTLSIEGLESDFPRRTNN